MKRVEVVVQSTYYVDLTDEEFDRHKSMGTMEGRLLEDLRAHLDEPTVVDYFYV